MHKQCIALPCISHKRGCAFGFYWGVKLLLFKVKQQQQGVKVFATPSSSMCGHGTKHDIIRLNCMPRKSGKGQSAVSLVQVCRHNKITGCKTVKRTKRERAAKFRGDFFPCPLLKISLLPLQGVRISLKNENANWNRGLSFFNNLNSVNRLVYHIVLFINVAEDQTLE